MTIFKVVYQIYASDGVTPVYTIPFVQSDNSPQDPQDYVEIQTLRGQGSIIIPGSTQSWDLDLEFYLQGTNYQTLMSAVDSYLATVVQQTKYVLSIQRSPNTYVTYNIMRLKPPKLETQDFRTTFIKVTQTFRVSCW